MEIRPGTTLMESIMVLTSDRSEASGGLKSRAVDNVRSTSSLANSSILVRYKKNKTKKTQGILCHHAIHLDQYI